MSADEVLIDNTNSFGTPHHAPVPGDFDDDLGMNLISANFDIVVVNRVNERLYGKSMVEFLGKKCYSEFEKRDSICPDCPGVEALRTGQPSTKENEGIRDDGSRFVVLCTAYPVLGPDNKPVGFIEVERDITDRRAEEKTSAVLNNLRSALAKADDCSWALRYTLDAALSLNAVESGCTYLVEADSGKMTMVSVRGRISPSLATSQVSDLVHGPTVAFRCLHSLPREEDDEDSPARWLVTLRIKSGSQVVALLFLGLTSPTISPSMRLALEALAEVATTAIGHIEAEHSRREQRARLRHVLQNLPLPVVCLDAEARITLCNRLAERLFGYFVGQSLDGEPPVLPKEDIEALRRLLRSREAVESRTMKIRSTDGESVDMQMLIASFPNEIDDVSRLILVGSGTR
jgi:PAS domain S-box-containing protein